MWLAWSSFEPEVDGCSVKSQGQDDVGDAEVAGSKNTTPLHDISFMGDAKPMGQSEIKTNSA